MENEKKSSAELAREERKARIEKTSKMQAEKKEKKANASPAKKRAKIITPIVIVVLVLAIALCCFFGVPERMSTAVKLSNGTKISVAEYEYYYKALYNNYYQTALQYEQYYGAYYGEGAGKTMTGFDYTKTPENQKYTVASGDTTLTDKYGKNPTWADYLEQTTVDTCQAFESFYDAAKAEKYTLSKDDKKEIDSYIEELRSTAAKSNYSMDAYLRQYYGRGMTEKLFRSIMEKQLIVSNYLEAKQAEYKDNVTDKEILAAYEKNPTEYQQMSLRCFTISSKAATNTDDTKYTDAELKAQTKKNNEEKIQLADKFLNEVNADNFTALTYTYADEDEKTYYKDTDQYSKLENVNYSNVKSYFSEDGAKWAFDSSRKVGDKTVIKVENDDGSVTLNVLLITSLPIRDDTHQPVSVRHILFALTKNTTDSTTGESKEETLRTKEEAKKLAEDTLAAWVKDGAKEEDFIKLANSKSDDTGSSDNGGLYEDVSKTSNYVAPFLDWCFADGRKVGDYGIVETEYGYHIMYMSKISDTAQWQSTIRDTLSTNAFNDYYEKVSTDKKYTPTLSKNAAKKVRKTVEKYASTVISNQQSSTTTTTAAATTTTAAATTTTAATTTKKSTTK